MPTRVKLDLIDAVAEAVVRLEDREVVLGAPGVLERLDAAGHGSDLPDALGGPSATLALERLLECKVNVEQVDRLKRRGLV
jgi:hypothetical protein